MLLGRHAVGASCCKDVMLTSRHADVTSCCKDITSCCKVTSCHDLFLLHTACHTTATVLDCNIGWIMDEHFLQQKPRAISPTIKQGLR